MCLAAAYSRNVGLPSSLWPNRAKRLVAPFLPMPLVEALGLVNAFSGLPALLCKTASNSISTNASIGDIGDFQMPLAGAFETGHVRAFAQGQGPRKALVQTHRPPAAGKLKHHGSERVDG